MSNRPDFAAQWYRTHFDPFKEDHDRALAAKAKQNRLTPRLLRPDPKLKAQMIIRGVITKRAKSRPVTLAKTWSDK